MAPHPRPHQGLHRYPAPNLYQSLHTSVMGPEGRHFEVQIRTEEMHRVAEEGIAAHWKYKKAAAEPRLTISAWHGSANWVEWQSEMRDPAEFMSTLKVDLYPRKSIPSRRVAASSSSTRRHAHRLRLRHSLRRGQHLHRRQGQRAHRPAQIRIAHGDVVEILTQPGHLPSKDWLSIVKTSRARNKIKHVINTTERVKAIEIGENTWNARPGVSEFSLGRIPETQVQAVAADYDAARSKTCTRPGIRQVFRAPGVAEARAGSGFRGNATRASRCASARAWRPRQNR